MIQKLPYTTNLSVRVRLGVWRSTAQAAIAENLLKVKYVDPLGKYRLTIGIHY